MAGQGTAIREIAEWLRSNDWTVLFVCVPNTPHVGVIPIPTDGLAKQRYTDVVAVKGSILKLIEVEIALNEKVAEDIAARLSEQRLALRRPNTWREWSSRVAASTGARLPTSPTIECELVVIRSTANVEACALMHLKEADVVLRSSREYAGPGRVSIG